MKKLLFATNNATKAKRFSTGLLEKGIEVISLKDIDISVEEPEENGSNAKENALIKARYYYNVTGSTTMAMDDNLYIEDIPDELQPGTYVRRVNGKRLSDSQMIEHYSNLAKKYGKDGKLTARWVYAIAIIKDDREYTYTWSKDDFYIVERPSDIINPGYPLNSISVNKKLNKYFTDMTDDDTKKIKEDETDVVEFIYNCIKKGE